MNDQFKPLFFRKLTRREKYSMRSATQFFPYAHYRKHYHYEIAEDCAERCVYCDIHEEEAGGREAMQIDHFRPHSRSEFECLKDDPRNFHHACGKCNNWKRAKWPSTIAEASHDGNVGFIDPFNDLRSNYFEILPDGELKAAHPVGAYLIRLFALNRKFLCLIRSRRILRGQLEEYVEKQMSQWEAAAKGQGEMTKEQLADDLDLCIKLFRLCSPTFSR